MSKVVVGKLQLVPDADWILGKPKELLDAKLDVLEAEVGSLALKVVHQPSPEEVLPQDLALVDYSGCQL